MDTVRIFVVGNAVEGFTLYQYLKGFGVDADALFLATRVEVQVLATKLGEKARALDTVNRVASDETAYFLIATKQLPQVAKIVERLNGLGVRPERIVLHDGLFSEKMRRLISTLCYFHPWPPAVIFEKLLKRYPESGIDPIRVLAEIQNGLIGELIDPSKKTLAVFYPSKAYRSNLGSIEMYETIAAQGYNVIHLFGVAAEDRYETRPLSFYAGHGLLEHMDFIDVVVYPTLSLGLPRRAKKVLLVHDIYDSPKGEAEAPVQAGGEDRAMSVSPFIDELDYNFLPSPSVMPVDPITHLKRKKPLCRIPGGYFKLDRNVRYADTYDGPVDSIIYAPTVIKGVFENYVSLPEHGEAIVAALLECFPDHRIIFRPHPHTVDTAVVKRLAARFHGHPGFVFDDVASFYMENYCRSKVMVSDMSGTAFTYAFTTLRPVVFFSHNEATVEQAFGNVRYFSDRGAIGYVATNIDELVGHCRAALDEQAGFRDRIAAFREENIFNIGKAEAYFAEHFHLIAEGRRHPDWQYVISPMHSPGLE